MDYFQIFATMLAIIYLYMCVKRVFTLQISSSGYSNVVTEVINNNIKNSDG